MNAKLKILKQYVKLRASLETERNQIKTRLQEINAALGDNVIPVSFKAPEVEAPAKSKRTVSAANRRAVSAAAKARWAKYRAEKTAKPKKFFSAATRARLAAAQKARWAKVKAAKQATS